MPKRKAEEQLGPDDDEEVSDLEEEGAGAGEKIEGEPTVAKAAVETATAPANQRGTSLSVDTSVACAGFSAYAKTNPFAAVTTGSSFLKSDKVAFGANGGLSSSSGSASIAGASCAISVSIPGESPKTPRSNPFAAISPSHNPFMTIVPGVGAAFEAVASAAASPASVTSNSAAASTSLGSITAPAASSAAVSSRFTFAPPKTAAFGPSGFALVATQSGPGLAFGSGALPSMAAATSSKLSASSSSSFPSLGAPAATKESRVSSGAGDEDGAGVDGGGDDPEEDLTPATFGKTYQLQGAPVPTGEEGEECLIQVRAKLYRLAQSAPRAASSSPTADVKDGGEANAHPPAPSGPGEWLEVGVGPARLLKKRASETDSKACNSNAAHEESENAVATNKLRVVMRREEKKGGQGKFTSHTYNKHFTAHSPQNTTNTHATSSPKAPRSCSTWQ